MRALCLALLLVGCSQSSSTSPPTSPAPVPQAAPVPEQADHDAAHDDAPADAPDAPPPVEQPAAQPASAPTLAEAGSSCLSGADCASGVCEGEGCDASSPGTCAPEVRPCSRDRRPYCGCDGETFFTSSTCVGRRYASKGPC